MTNPYGRLLTLAVWLLTGVLVSLDLGGTWYVGGAFGLAFNELIDVIKYGKN